MTEMNYAAIDIGSNAARLLVKRIEENEGQAKFTKELLLRVPLRLGFDVFGKGKISEKREKNMMRLMKSYAYLMKIYDVCAMPRTVWTSSRKSRRKPVFTLRLSADRKRRKSSITTTLNI